MTFQLWSGQWLSIVTLPDPNVNQVLGHCMASFGHNELTHWYVNHSVNVIIHFLERQSLNALCCPALQLNLYVWNYAVPLMTLVARLAPDLRDRDTVCLNSYCSLNSRARWKIFGKLQTKLLNFSEQSITHGSVTLKPTSRSNHQWTMHKI